MLKLNQARSTLQASLAALLLVPTIVSADWSGGYAGAQLDALVGDDIFVTPVIGGGIAVPEDSLDVDTTFSGFAGYQIQQGDIVLGGEFAIGQANGVTVDDFDADLSDARMIDLKARVGYDLGDTLVYGVAGFSQSRLLDTDNAGIDFLGLDLDTSTGINYGFGVDYKVNEQFTVGAEYLIRELSVEDDIDRFGENVTARVDTQLETFGVRAAFHF